MGSTLFVGGTLFGAKVARKSRGTREARPLCPLARGTPGPPRVPHHVKPVLKSCANLLSRFLCAEGCANLQSLNMLMLRMHIQRHQIVTPSTPRNRAKILSHLLLPVSPCHVTLRGPYPLGVPAIPLPPTGTLGTRPCIGSPISLWRYSTTSVVSSAPDAAITSRSLATYLAMKSASTSWPLNLVILVFPSSSLMSPQPSLRR